MGTKLHKYNTIKKRWLERMMRIIRQTTTKIKIDRLDIKILKCLNKDFRMKLTEISKQTEAPVSTIYTRIQKLKPHLKWGIGLNIKLTKQYKKALQEWIEI